MVYVNSKKFACESCIKGHRSSSCTHTDRPLYEIKKKGRPVSQCQKCRDLRQNKRVHSKCTCNDNKDQDATAAQAKKDGVPPARAKRFRPIAPALPNGLRDVIPASGSDISLPADVRQRVDTLLNPCPCKDVWKCQCRAASGRSTGPQGASTSNSSAGLDALCQAAAVLQVPTPSHSRTSRTIKKAGNKRLSSRPASPTRDASGCGSCCSAKKRRKNSVVTEKGPDLPPLLLDSNDILSLSSSSSPLPSLSIPTFDGIPPLSAIQSIAGTGCTCGVTCACPGCVEHRGKEHASTSHKDCADGCGTCVDHDSFILPSADGASSSTSSSSTNFLDAFFARAAALPQPPSPRLRLSTISLDPTNITTYPDFAISISSSKLEVGRAFGLVTVPKLECCGGSCGCPSGTCGCGEKCNGCCEEHLEKVAKDAETEHQAAASVLKAVTDLPLVAVPSRSCCAGKA